LSITNRKVLSFGLSLAYIHVTRVMAEGMAANTTKDNLKLSD
jgi:hypothetical protein